MRSLAARTASVSLGAAPRIQVQHYAQSKGLVLLAFYEAQPEGSFTGSIASTVAQQIGDRLCQKEGSDCPVFVVRYTIADTPRV